MSKDRYSLALRVLDDFFEWCTKQELNPTMQRFEKWLLANKENYHATQINSWPK